MAQPHGRVAWPGGLDLAPDAMYHDIKLHGERLAGKAASITTHDYRFDRDAANERS